MKACFLLVPTSGTEIVSIRGVVMSEKVSSTDKRVRAGANCVRVLASGTAAKGCCALSGPFQLSGLTNHDEARVLGRRQSSTVTT